MEVDFRSLITSDGAVAGLVGNRVYWGAIEQTAANPCVRLTLISGAPVYASKGAAGLTSSRVQVDVRADSYAAARAVADAVEAVINGFSGISGTTHFRSALMLNQRAIVETLAGELQHLISSDFEVWHKPAA